MPGRRIVTVHSGGPSGPSWVSVGDGLFPSHDGYPIPTLGDLRLGEFAEGVSALHDIGRALALNVAVFKEPEDDFVRTFGNHSIERWAEIAELLRSAGEAGELVAAALREADGHLAQSDAFQFTTAPLIGSFITEGAAQYLLSVGHNLANIALRLCMENRSCVRRLDQNAPKAIRRAMEAAVPGAASADAWIFHAKMHDVAAALSGSRTAQARFARTAALLERAPDWRRMSTVRHAYFHRWRYGFAASDAEAADAALSFLSATITAAACLGRAMPSLLYALLDAMPRSRHGRGTPLMGMISTRDWYSDGRPPGPMQPLLAMTRFRG
jgi:hypothetical protein